MYIWISQARLNLLGSPPLPFSLRLSLSLFFFFWLPGMKDLGSPTGIKPMPPAMEIQGLNHWASQGSPKAFENPEKKLEERTHPLPRGSLEG